MIRDVCAVALLLVAAVSLPVAAQDVGLTEGLPTEIEAANAAFAERIDMTFPVGSSVAVMEERLEGEGFVTWRNSDGTGSAWRSSSWLFCETEVSVDWAASGDEITEVAGGIAIDCL